MIVKRHILQRFLEAMGYEVLLHRIASERVPGQVCGVKTKNAAAEVESLKTAALDVARLCPKDAKDWGNEATREVLYHIKRHGYDDERGILYFPTVFWNAERFSSSFARQP